MFTDIAQARVQVVNSWTIKDYKDEAIAVVLSFCDNEEDTSVTAVKSVIDEENIEFYYFLDSTPEEILGKSTVSITEEDVADLYDVVANFEQVCAILNTIHKYSKEDYRYGSLLLHSSRGIGRAPCFAVAYELISGKSPYDAFFSVVKSNPECQFNFWIMALIDTAMHLNGRLTQATEEFNATGIVVSSSGEFIEAEWAKR